MRHALAGSLIVLLATLSCADEPRMAEPARASAPPASAPAGSSVDALAWMAGHWMSSEGDESSEELWLAPKAGLMVGVNRSVVPGGKAFFEYLRIEQRGGSVVYVASPGGGPTTDFTLTSSTASAATFENPQHDFPKRIVYHREGDILAARVDAGAGSEKGFELRWTRVK